MDLNLDRWEERHINLLICCWKDHKGLFGNGKTTKKEVLKKIATSFNSKSHLRVSADQCARKWAKLEAKLKEVTDHNNKSGNSHKKWKYYSEMADCIGMNAAVRPTYTLESSSCVISNEGVESDSSDDGDYSTETPQKKTLRKRPAKKRKSRSSASQMLTFLQEYQEKKEEVENKKVKMMEEMNEEKKLFWPNLLKVLNNK